MSARQLILPQYTEPDYFRIDVAEAYKQLRLDVENDATHLLKMRVYHNLRAFSRPDGQLKNLQGHGLKHVEKQRGGRKSTDEIKAFVYEIGGWFHCDETDKDFIARQLTKGEEFLKAHKDKSFCAAAVAPPPAEEEKLDDILVEMKLREMTGDNYSHLFANTKSSITSRALGTDSAIYNIDNEKPVYKFIGVLAAYNRQELLQHGYDEKTVDRIETELGVLGLQLDIFEKAKNLVRRDLASKDNPSV